MNCHQHLQLLLCDSWCVLQSGKDPVLVWKVLRALSRESVKTLRSVLEKQKNLEVVVREHFPQVQPRNCEPMDMLESHDKAMLALSDWLD